MPDEAPDDPIARLRADADQAREQTKELARTLGVFYAEAMGSGFERDEAMQLTSELLGHLMFLSRGGEDD